MGAQLLFYSCYNDKTCCYEYYRREYSFYPFSKVESITTSVKPIRCGSRVDETVAGCSLETVHAIPHFPFALLFEQRQIACNSSINTLEDQNGVELPLNPLPVSCSWRRATVCFSEFEKIAAEILKIEKHVPHPLKVVKLDDAVPSSVEQLTQISTTIPYSSKVFGSASLYVRGTSHKRAMENSDSGRR